MLKVSFLRYQLAGNSQPAMSVREREQAPHRRSADGSLTETRLLIARVNKGLFQRTCSPEAAVPLSTESGRRPILLSLPREPSPHPA